MVSAQALAQPSSRLLEIAQTLLAAGFGQHLKDAPARTAQRSRDYIDADSAGAQFDYLGAARGRIGDIDAIAAINFRELEGGVMADGLAQRIVRPRRMRHADV